MRCQPAGEVGPLRHDPGGVDVGVDDVVVLLDLDEVDGVAEARRLEQVPGIGPQHRHLAQLAAVAFEVAVVDGVEPGQGGEQPHVGLGDGVAHQVSPIGQPIAHPVQRGEQPVVGRLVGLLRTGEAAPVHTVVDFGVHPLVHLIDLGAQPLGVQLGRTVAVVCGPLRRQIQRHLREVVGHHRPGPDVHDGGHRDALGVAGEPLEVGVLQPGNLEDRVDAAGIEIERPAALVVGGAAKANGQNTFQAQQPAHDDRPVGPRAGARHDQPIAAGLDRVAVAAVGGDAGGDVVGVAGELPRPGDVAGHTSNTARTPDVHPSDANQIVRNRRARLTSVDGPSSQWAIHGPEPSDWSMMPSSSQA
ncbi:hypothetical protein MAA44156_03270 [Mycobacterium avium subsp. avium]|nr:hypothetical protein MAA44156_03270 [Mycobacterium avium subsp. avium]